MYTKWTVKCDEMYLTFEAYRKIPRSIGYQNWYVRQKNNQILLMKATSCRILLSKAKFEAILEING